MTRQKSKVQIVFEVAVRVLLVTFIFTLLGFAVGLFCGIGIIKCLCARGARFAALMAQGCCPCNEVFAQGKSGVIA